MTNITDEVLHKKLEHDEWLFEKPLSETGFNWQAYKRFDGFLDCSQNDRAPAVMVTPYRLEIKGVDTWCSVEISLTGQLPDGRWVNYKVYSIHSDEVFEYLPKAVDLLKTIWNASVLPFKKHTTQSGC